MKSQYDFSKGIRGKYIRKVARVCGFCGKSIENNKLKDLRTVRGSLVHIKCVKKVDAMLARKGIV